MTTRPGYIKDSLGEWIQIGPAVPVGSTVYYQASEPSSPTTGDIWIDSDDDVPSVNSTLYYRWKKTATGGETSFTGTDDNSLTLAYTAGYESVFINGVLQVRGSDYTATTGTSITGLTALTAGDIVMVESVMAYSVGDTYTQSVLDGKFSPITTTGLVLLNTTTLSAAASASIDNVFTSTYSNYKITIDFTATSTANNDIYWYGRSGSPAADTTSNYNNQQIYISGGSVGGSQESNGRIGSVSTTYPTLTEISFDLFSPNLAKATTYTSLTMDYSNAGAINGRIFNGWQQSTTQFTGIKIYPLSGTITGTIKVYGYK
jgi:hypothetical protein